jgi:hypothetical protein
MTSGSCRLPWASISEARLPIFTQAERESVLAMREERIANLEKMIAEADNA